MKKTTFYSLMKKNGKVIAVLHEGYTDGEYNYYKDKYNWWNAIHPACGLSVAAGRPRKLVAEQAHDRAEAIANEMERTGKHFAKQFEKAIAESKEAQRGTHYCFGF